MLIYELADGAFMIKKAIEMLKFDIGKDHNNYWFEIVEDIFFKVSKVGIIGLLSKMGYLDNIPKEYAYLVVIKYRSHLKKDNLEYKVCSGWRGTYKQRWTDHYIILKKLGYNAINNGTAICVFAGFSKYVVDFIIEEFKDDYTKASYIIRRKFMNNLVNLLH